MARKLLFGVISLYLLGLLIIPQTTNSQSTQDCTISIDRSAVPSLNFNEITIVVQLNDASDIVVRNGSTPISYTQVGPNIMFNTDASEVVVTHIPGTNLANLCETSVAPLRDDKKWVWSHGFDDNVGLALSIDEFKAKSWPATIFLIAKDYDPIRDESHWIIDEPYINSQIIPTEGWVIGNHSWNHERFEVDNPTIEDYRNDILDAQVKLEESIDRSSNPDFKIISFAAPNFSDKYEQPFADVAAITDLLLLETGGDFLITVNETTPYSEGNLNASPFNGRNKIGRDPRIEWSPEEVIGIMDLISANSSEYRRLWYNSLAHGNQEANIKQVLDHAYNNYGPAGTNELWVATSTEVYSYLTIRDNVQISVASSENGDALESTPESTPASTPESTPESTPASTPEFEGDYDIYLPMITAMRNWASKLTGDPVQDQVPNLLLKVSGHGLQQMKD